MQEMDLLAALSRNLLPFPRLLGPLLLPGGERVGDPLFLVAYVSVSRMVEQNSTNQSSLTP